MSRMPEPLRACRESSPPLRGGREWAPRCGNEQPPRSGGLLSRQALRPPIRRDEAGAFRVGESRVLLELVVRAFQDGATPEAIVRRYPTVTLADVYGVIASYLRDPGPIDEYLAERERLAAEVGARVAPPAADLAAIRERLRVRRGGAA